MPAHHLAPFRLASHYAYLFRLRALGAVPVARDAQNIRHRDIRAARLLLLANGPAVGWGVMSHSVALPGQLSAALGRSLEVPVDVDFVGAEVMSVDSAHHWLTNLDLGEYDAVAVMVGHNDAMRALPLAVWERHLRALLERLGTGLRDGVPVVVVGTEVGESPTVVELFRSTTEEHSAEMNAITEAVARERGLLYAPSPRLRATAGRAGGREAYAEFAEALTPHLAAPLAAYRAAMGLPRRGVRPSETFAWAGAREALRHKAVGGTPRMKTITERVRHAFRAEFAVVSMVQNGHTHYLTFGGMPTGLPAELTHCKTVVETDAPLVVPDSRLDARFAGNPLLGMSKIIGYTGTPLHAANGDAIGSLCLMDAVPRIGFTRRKMRRLQRFARMLEQELRTFEDPSAEQARRDTRAMSRVAEHNRLFPGTDPARGLPATMVEEIRRGEALMRGERIDLPGYAATAASDSAAAAAVAAER